jgi:hypothetical protein
MVIVQNRISQIWLQMNYASEKALASPYIEDYNILRHEIKTS